MPNKHRLAVKLEETVLGNGNWDKVTVKIPNPSYILTEVKYENNKLSILFEYSNETAYNPQNFSFMLSAFGVNPNDVSENDEFFVVGIDDSAVTSDRQAAHQSFPGWLTRDNYQGNFVLVAQANEAKIGKFRCPIHCPPNF